MKKTIIFIILLLIISSNVSCNKMDKFVVVAYFKDESVYSYEVNSFVELKVYIMKIYDKNLDEIEKIIPSNEITEEEYLDFIEFCQVEYSKNEINRYLELSEEEKVLDYYVSLIRYEYFVAEFESGEIIDQINEYNKTQILEHVDDMYLGDEIVGAIKVVAENYNMSFNECIEKVYLNVALDISLQNYKPETFIKDYYEGKVFEDIDKDSYMQLGGLNEFDGNLQEYWTITESYYNFLADMSSQFYDYLKEKVLVEVDFK